TNLVAANTREGRVLKTLREKLNRIRQEVGSDKVLDVLGRLFEGVSIRDYMGRVLENDPETTEREIDALITTEKVKDLERENAQIYGSTGDVREHLPELQADVERADRLRLLPGYVRRFVEEAAPLVGLKIDGDL